MGDSMKLDNQIGMNGISFVEFSTNNPAALHRLFTEFGFSKTAKHNKKNIDLYVQNEIVFLLNYEPDTFGFRFQKQHGPCISSMGWRFSDPEAAYAMALKKGAQAAVLSDYSSLNGNFVSAVNGIGNSLIYFVSDKLSLPSLFSSLGFISLQDSVQVPSKGFTRIDHLTNNVYEGTMNTWAQFYKDVFGFTEVRYFDIKGKKTGLNSFALKSPCGQFCIPINEAKESKSQINEYLEEYKGPGIQHLAFLTDDLISSMEQLHGTGIETLDIDENYYESIFKRVPNVTEDKKAIQKFNILVDGDEDGYLLQIFTKNLVGPIFIELIQRQNHLSFGEGNFQALFESIERDQMKRGVL
jgi:4-hydroxyphenylpyruvate dioxygenase